jgi:hypothetical protein
MTLFPFTDASSGAPVCSIGCVGCEQPKKATVTRIERRHGVFMAGSSEDKLAILTRAGTNTKTSSPILQLQNS